MSGNFEVEWDTAMVWWKGQSSFVQQAIRSLASKRLSAHLAGTGQGISSSDINHEVFSMHKQYLAAGMPDIISWLIALANY